MVTLFVGAVVVIGFLGWSLFRHFGPDRIAEFMEERRAASSMVGRGDFVDGTRHLAVAMALTPTTLFYENSDIQAYIELQWVREIEYDTELATGSAVEGAKVLRLRSGSQTYEFIIPNEMVPRWHMNLPSRRPIEKAVNLAPRLIAAI